jgi:hypothetical protein
MTLPRLLAMSRRPIFMNKDTVNQHRPPSEEAIEPLRRYLRLAMQVIARAHPQPGGLTESNGTSTIGSQRSTPSSN